MLNNRPTGVAHMRSVLLILTILLNSTGTRFPVKTAGLQADLVILKDDPSRNLRALTAVQYTLRAGKVIYRASR